MVINYKTHDKNLMKNISRRWFFCDPNNDKCLNTFYNIKNDIGIIFYKKKNLDSNFFKLLKEYVDVCKKTKKIFLIPHSVYWAKKYNANGVYISIHRQRNSLSTRLNLLKTNKLIVATSIHNMKEMYLSRKANFDFIFISPAFKTNSHKELAEHRKIRFINLCKYSNTNVFALGGMNEVRFKSLKNKYLTGFGGIESFNYL
ncbi:MAG: hypothetical protein CMM91_01050 [Rickettsiales bacterium]|nr:hypothetical protein [Rickettsiales bacterium]OUV54804.1 MAG: hypothetical protein CBC87_00490 [Rickettsiales bacterium TMED127]|tara:strand:- start:13108 stop:13710 length:603 start_codon:yes stop_codon:yes gene_type:complete